MNKKQHPFHKELDEMRAIIKKLHLCLTCLCKPEKDHKCPVGKCHRCGGGHNVLICGKAEEEKSLAAGEQSDPSEDDSEDEAFDDFTNNSRPGGMGGPK